MSGEPGSLVGDAVICPPTARTPMSDAQPFAAVVLGGAVVGLLAVLSNRLTERIRIPSPLLVLVGAAVAVAAVPALKSPSERLVERLVTGAPVCILFNGGPPKGGARVRGAGGPRAIPGGVGAVPTPPPPPALLPPPLSPAR